MKNKLILLTTLLLICSTNIMGMAKSPDKTKTSKMLYSPPNCAGIFPWAYYKNNVVFLFGYDKNHQECIIYKDQVYEPDPSYGDFGGHKKDDEPTDATAIRKGNEEVKGDSGGHSKKSETTAETAIREGNEETNNIYKFIDKDLSDAPYIEARNYRTYLVKVGYVHRKTLLKKAINDEITDFHWVKARDFIATLKDPHATTVPSISDTSITIKKLGLRFWRAEKSARRVYDPAISHPKPASPKSWREPREEPTRKSTREIHPPRAPEPIPELLRLTLAQWLERFTNRKERMKTLRPRSPRSYSYSPSYYSYSYSAYSGKDKQSKKSDEGPA